MAQRRVRSPLVVIIGPVRDLCPGMIEAEEQALVEKLVAHAAVEAPHKSRSSRLSRRNEMPQDSVVLRPGEPLGLPFFGHNHAGLPTTLDQFVNSRATRRPEIQVLGIDAKLFHVTSSTMFRMRTGRPPAKVNGRNPGPSERSA
jgi:hypothetical protein